jgi:hypothetical protein
MRMEITHMNLDDMYTSLANSCLAFEGQQEGACFADASNFGCPFGASEEDETVRCGDIRPEHWREVFEGKDEEPEPEMQFRFGDKVTAMIDPPCEAVFSTYTSHGGAIMAWVLFEGEHSCEEVLVSDLKAGWNG